MNQISRFSLFALFFFFHTSWSCNRLWNNENHLQGFKDKSAEKECIIFSENIETLAFACNNNPLDIISYTEPLKPYLKPFYIDYLFNYSSRDTTALNWILHALKGNTKNDTSNYLIIPNIIANIINKQFLRITKESDTSTNKSVLRINGKNFQQDWDNGVQLNDIEIEHYFSYSFKPAIYPNLIAKDYVEKDREVIITYLLCCTIWGNIKVPKPVTNHCIIPQLCSHSYTFITECWNSIYENMQNQIASGVTRNINNNELKPHRKFFQNYNEWYLAKQKETLENMSFQNIQDIIGYHFKSQKKN